MRPYQAYLMIKSAEEAPNNGLEIAKHHAGDVAHYIDANKGRMAQSSANNVLYGLLSNPRGAGPASILGGSAGGVLDGILMKPITDAAIEGVGFGLRKMYGLGQKPAQANN